MLKIRYMYNNDTRILPYSLNDKTKLNLIAMVNDDSQKDYKSGLHDLHHLNSVKEDCDAY